jgi:threonine dehydrogenase-like Zn-dependent dehydrogenase
MEWFAHSGSCRFCRTGAYNLCERIERTSGGSHSGFAEYVVAHVSSLFKVPEGISASEAAMIEPLAVAVRAHGRAMGNAGGTLLVMGAGTIGLLVTAVGKIFGSARVITAARYPHQAERAAKWGADAVVLPGKTGIEARVWELTAGAWADAVVETTASASGLAAAVACVRPAGRVALVGGFHKPREVDLKRVVDNEITLTGCLCYSYTGLQRDFDAAIDLIASRRLDAGALITHRFPLTEIEKALAAAADKGGGSIKVQVYNSAVL